MVDVSASDQLPWLIPSLFLLWRVQRGGRLSWAVLIAFRLTPLIVAPLWVGDSVYATGWAALLLLQLVCLLTPALRRRVSATPGPAQDQRVGALDRPFLDRPS